MKEGIIYKYIWQYLLFLSNQKSGLMYRECKVTPIWEQSEKKAKKGDQKKHTANGPSCKGKTDKYVCQHLQNWQFVNNQKSGFIDRECKGNYIFKKKVKKQIEIVWPNSYVNILTFYGKTI